MTPKGHVFVSFASADAELARRVVEALERSGLRCWIADRDIQAATSYPAAVTAAVRHSGVLLLLLTESANSSRHVLREVELAFNGRRPILPVRLAGVTPSSDLQYFLSTTQWLDTGLTVDDADLARVARRAAELLAAPGAGGGRPAGETRLPVRLAQAAAVLVVAAAIVVFWTRRNDGDVPGDPAAGGAPVPATVTAGAAAGATRESDPSAPTMKTNPRDGGSYVWVPPGRFLMGCSPGDFSCEDDERPVHTVDLTRGFWLSRTEVTVAQYRNATPGAAGDDGDQPALPVAGVSWAKAKEYCATVGGRLPTEAEWEYAARAGTETASYDRVPEVAWFSGNSDDRRQPVALKPPNAFGLYDMLGNVSEWVLDRYYNAYDESSGSGDIEQPLAGNASGVARGGSWVSDASGVRASRRLPMPPDAEEPHIGVRCAVDDL